MLAALYGEPFSTSHEAHALALGDAYVVEHAATLRLGHKPAELRRRIERPRP